jgi:hypothetical protein
MQNIYGEISRKISGIARLAAGNNIKLIVRILSSGGLS